MNWSNGAYGNIAESRGYSGTGSVPEPGTLALLGFGAGALVMRRGKRRESYEGRDGMYDKLGDFDKAGRNGEVVSGLGKMVYSDN